MASSIEAILAFITALISLVIFVTSTAINPQFGSYGAILTGVEVASVITSPISAFFVTMAVSYFSILLYNHLAPRIGGIKIELTAKEVNHISVVPLALNLAIIEGILAFIIGLLFTLVLLPLNTLITGTIPVLVTNISNLTNTIVPVYHIPGMGSLALILIILLPAMVFALGFISSVLITLAYNYVGARIAKLQLDFIPVAGSLYELRSIPVAPAAVVAAIIFGVFGSILGILSILGFINLVTLSTLGNVLGGIAFRSGITLYFVPYIVIVALVAIFYNFLVPRIGGIKLYLK